MKNYFIKFNCLIFLLFFTGICLAGPNKLTTSTFSIALPTNMKLDLQNEDEVKKIYQYVLQLPPFDDYSPQQIRITVVGQTPKNSAETNEWETRALGATIAMFTNSYHLDLSKQSDVLGAKPEIVKLGKQTFTAAKMNFDTMQTYFLVTTTKSATYNIILVSIDKDIKMSTIRMQQLLDAIKTMEYFEIKNRT